MRYFAEFLQCVKPIKCSEGEIRGEQFETQELKLKFASEQRDIAHHETHKQIPPLREDDIQRYLKTVC